MPRLITALDPQPRVPSIPTVTWWSRDLPPWQQRITDRLVDAGRTSQLSAFDDRVRTRGGVPLQLAATNSTTPTLHTSEPPTWTNPVPSVRLPLQAKVWVEQRTSDHNWFAVDPVKQLYYEASSMGPALSWLQSPWRAGSIRVYDLTRRWDEQRPSITGGGIPMWPMVPHPDQLAAGAGAVQHALHFVVDNGYSSEPYIAPARKSDGLRAGHPLRAGARLRLSEASWLRLQGQADTPEAAAVVWALAVYGAIVNDRTSDVGHNLRLPSGVTLDLDMRLTDFEVLF
jgi:hypothetical protein